MIDCINYNDPTGMEDTLEVMEYEKTVDFFQGQDLSKGFDLKHFLEYNYSKNRFYPYGKYDTPEDKVYAEGLLKENLEFANQDIQIVRWELHHGSSYSGSIGNGKRSSWTEYSFSIDYLQNGVLKGRVFHLNSTRTITDDK